MRRSLKVSLFGIVIVAILLVAANMAAGNTPQLGLDLQGGASVVYRPKQKVKNDTLDQAIEIIRNRVDATGVAEPDIARQGDSIVVQLPGVKNQQRALELIGRTAELRFRPVLEVLPPENATTTTTKPTTTTTAKGSKGKTSSTTTAEGSKGKTSSTTTSSSTTTTTIPGTTPPNKDDPKKEVILPGRPDDEQKVRYRLGPSQLTGRALSTAKAGFDQNGARWVVRPTFTGDGIKGFNAIAGPCNRGEAICPTRQLAITLDGVVQSAPTIQQPSFERDSIEISGSFDQGSAKDLALVLRYGALPVELERETVQTVSPSLGKDSLRAGLIAGFVGVLLVLVLMVLYYRFLAILVVVGLALSGCLLWTCISVLSRTSGLSLTLAGVTGIIVSIGVTVDSYVVFLERLKDDVRAGKSLRASTPRSFKSAWRTIVAADVVSLIGAAVLWYLSVGSVRGFAFFLGLSTVLDLVVTYFFVRPAAILMSQGRFFRGREVLGVHTGEAVLAGAGT